MSETLRNSTPDVARDDACLGGRFVCGSTGKARNRAQREIFGFRPASETERIRIVDALISGLGCGRVLAETHAFEGARESLSYDPLSPEVIADPYPWYRRLLEEAPVHHDERNDLWVLSRYDDVHRAVRSHAALSSDAGSSSPARSCGRETRRSGERSDCRFASSSWLSRASRSRARRARMPRRVRRAHPDPLPTFRDRRSSGEARRRR